MSYPDGTYQSVEDSDFDPLTGLPKVISTANGTVHQDVNAKGQVITNTAAAPPPSPTNTTPSAR